ncbi:MAG: ABC transporter ATP-binding protein [bacterium]
MSEALLKVIDLKKHFPIKKGVFSKTIGYVYALDGVTFSLKNGESLGIVGESGCGKSTMARAILRLIEPTGGKVIFEKQNILSLKKNELRNVRKNMQIIFQDPYASLDPRKSIEQTVGEPLEIFSIYSHKERKEWIYYLLDKVGLSAKQASFYPHEFSGGQRQRIGIARALALKPKLVIGDEPVSALDVSIQAQVINLMEDIKKEFQLSYIIIAHDLAVVKYMCDRIAVMYLGRIVELATDDELYKNPLHPYTKGLMSSIPKMDTKNRKNRIILRGDVPSPVNPPSGCHFHTRCYCSEKQCSFKTPELINMGNDHYVACHRI